MAPLALSPMPAAYIAHEAPLFLRQNDASTSCYTTTITQTRVQTLSRQVSPVVAQPSGTGSGALQTTTTTEVLFETLLSTVLQTQTFTVTVPAPLSTSPSAGAAATSLSSLIAPAPTDAATGAPFAPNSASASPPTSTPGPATASEPVASASTETSTSASSAPAASSSASAAPSYGRRGSLAHPNSAQITTLWATPLLLFLSLLAWGMKGVRAVLYPWKMYSNFIHEGSHIVVGLLLGAQVNSVTIDPDRGAISGMMRGVPVLTLGAGYVGSAAFGAALIFCAFDTRASKIACLATIPLWAPVAWFGTTWTRIRIALAVGVTIACWFIDHAIALRFYMLFLGVLCGMYVLTDALDDFVFAKQNESDAALFSRLAPPGPWGWALLWTLFTLALFALALVGGCHFLTLSTEAQRHSRFLPT